MQQFLGQFEVNNDSITIADWRYYDIQDEMKKRASFGGAVQNLNSDIVKAILIPVPAIEKQEELCAILNRFDHLCNDLYSGLPAEIEARQKQYEHYRDKLLTFKEKD